MGERRTAFRLPHLRASGAWQMSADAALLDWCARGEDRLVFRTYDWDSPTLSLGRAEPFPDGWDEEAIRAEGIAVVRRPTGGDAVLHDQELTFAIAASIPGPWNLSPRSFSDRAADALADALTSIGVNASRVGARAPESAPGARPGALPCFAGVAPGEVQASGFKVAGLASRFARSAALCHASVPLSARHRDVARYRRDGARDRAALERHSRSVGELLATRPEVHALADRLADAVAARFGAPLCWTDLSVVGLEAP